MVVVQRLDGQSISAALAAIVIARTAEDPGEADRILAIAMNRPLAHDGKTLAQLLARAAIQPDPKSPSRS